MLFLLFLHYYVPPVNHGHAQNTAQFLSCQHLVTRRYLLKGSSTISVAVSSCYPDLPASRGQTVYRKTAGCNSASCYLPARNGELFREHLNHRSPCFLLSSRPNSNLVSAIIIPLLSAASAHFLYSAMVLSRSSQPVPVLFPGSIFQVRYALFKEIFFHRDHRSLLGRRGVNRFRQFIGFFQSRKFDTQTFPVFL